MKNYLHSHIHYCSGYQKFLTNQKLNKLTFNWGFFFTGLFWFTHHKLYVIQFLFSFSFFYSMFYFYFIGMNFDILALTIFSITIVWSYLSYYFYNMKCNKILYDHQYDLDLSLKKIKPLNLIFTLAISIFINFITLQLAWIVIQLLGIPIVIRA